MARLTSREARGPHRWNLVRWYFTVLLLGMIGWVISGIVTGRIGFVVFGGIGAVVFGVVSYENTDRSIARRDYEGFPPVVGRRRPPRT